MNEDNSDLLDEDEYDDDEDYEEYYDDNALYSW